MVAKTERVNIHLVLTVVRTNIKIELQMQNFTCKASILAVANYRELNLRELIYANHVLTTQYSCYG